MDKSIRVQVKEPCHQNWQNMTDNEKGKFCGSCQKTVVDFTLMSDNQILHHLSKATGSTCGRFANDQLDRELKAQVIKPKSKWAYFINLLIPIFLSSSSSNSTKGEPTIVSGTGNHTDPKKDYDGILGQLSVTHCQAPMIIADVDTTIEVLGMLALERVPNDIIKGEVKVDTAVKFIPPVITSNDTAVPKFMGDTIIFVGFENPPIKPEICLSGFVGGISYQPVEIKRPVINWIKDTLNVLGIRKMAKVYPNPVIAGQSITIDFSPRSLGEYQADIIDMNGRTIYSRKLNMVFEKQSFQVSTLSQWAKGMYIIRITGEGKDNVHNVKVVVR